MPAGQLSLAGRVGRVGRSVRLGASRWQHRAAFLGNVLSGVWELRGGARGLAVRTTVQQVRFTAVHALPLIATIALIVGGTVILQAYAQAVRFGVSDMPARILVAVVVRELGPLITAMVVLGRSGTAIAAELAGNGVLGETEALEASGINPVQHFTLPRVAGLSLSAVILTIYFDAIAFASGIMAARVLADVPVVATLDALRMVLSPADVGMTVAKAALFGAGIGAICSYHGLSVMPQRPTDLPRAVTAAVVSSLLFVFLVSAVVTFLTYA